MNCIACSKPATPDPLQFGKGTRYICEHCGKVFTDQGQASELEMRILQKEHFEQAVTQQVYKPLRVRLAVLGVRQAGNVRMLSPMHEREVGFQDRCVLRGR